MRFKKLLLPVALLTVALTASAFKLSRFHVAPSSDEERTARVETLGQSHSGVATAAPEEYVRRGELVSRLRSALAILGDRLERPGKERLSMTGTLRRGGASSASTFVMFCEFPGRLRFDEQAGTSRRVVVHRGEAVERSARPPLDADDIETLALDTAEHFFSSLARGAAMRHLGDNFRPGDSSTDGPTYNLYEITEDSDEGVGVRQQTKVYGLNSDTLLLELVRYEMERDGSPLKVEVRLGDWRRVAGQMVPHRIERLENGLITLTLDIHTVVVSARVKDGAFDMTAAN